jgi:hypothetical protein
MGQLDSTCSAPPRLPQHLRLSRTRHRHCVRRRGVGFPAHDLGEHGEVPPPLFVALVRGKLEGEARRGDGARRRKVAAGPRELVGVDAEGVKASLRTRPEVRIALTPGGRIGDVDCTCTGYYQCVI